MNGIPFFARQPILKSLTVFAVLVACLTGCSSSSDEQATENSESQVEETDQSSATGSTEEETDQATKEDTSSEENTPAPPASTDEETESDDTEEQADPEPSEQNEETEDDDTEEQADPEPSEQDEEETPTEKPAQRIEFTTDDIGTIIEGGILRGDASPVYVLRASAQQLMQLTLISLEDNASLDVVAPNGEKLVTNIKRTKILLPTDGDYLIYINPLRGNVSYSLDVLITNIVEYIPVEFAAGTSSTIISGGMLRGETGPVYGLVAAAGQRMEIAITSLEENASFDVLTPSGGYLLSEIEGQEFNFSANLPEDGEYLITTNALRGNVSFNLDISIRDSE
ncbi:MAG: hypothetical protein P8J01_04925 [Acidimicrobiales bacterium]|nr:hypothetical protein [Acidimicrobiales bacterium]